MTNTNTNTNTNTTTKFRLYTKKIFLTYASHLEQLKIDEILGWVKKWKVIEWLACHETGESGYEHTHLMICMDNKFQTTNCRYFDIDGLHPNVEGVKNYEASKNYIKKAGEYWGMIADEKEGYMPILVERIQKAPSLTEAMKLGRFISDASGIKAIYDARKPGEEEALREFQVAKPRGWQIGLWDQLLYPGNDRQINWLWDAKGGSGKTYFMKMFYANHPDDTIVMFAISRAIDAMNLISNAIEIGKKMKYVFINLTRQLEDRGQVYTIIEQIKDGWITNNKYKCLTIPNKSPHVTVFANFEPDRSKLSMDRWCVSDIGEEGVKRKGDPVTLNIGSPQTEDDGSWLA